jgi:pyruvate formate-lyase/glycerol dehydratase family glycyl radical enzyme
MDMDQSNPQDKIIPWWVRRNAPWHGEIFSRMMLSPEDPREMRIQSIREKMLPRFQDAKFKLSIQQARLVTESYKKTTGYHPAVRRALAFQKIMQEISISLFPGQIFLGNSSSGPNCVDFNPFFLPLDADLWDETGDGIQNPFTGAEERYVFSPDDRAEFENDILPYWKDQCREAIFFRDMKLNEPEAWRFLRFGMGYRTSPLIGNGLAHTIQDKVTVLNKGLIAIKKEIQTRLDEIDSSRPGSILDMDRRNQYQAMLMSADAILTYARRNAAFAEELAARESDPQRKQELLQMAQIANKVPAYPAETWQEALQSFLFLRNATAIGEGADSHSAGRFDQFMLPFLQKGIQSGKLSPQDAQMQLEMFYLKWNESRGFNLSASSSGGGNNDKINISGVDENGMDCTNELSYRLLEAYAHVHLIDPNHSVRLHKKTPPELLRATLEVIRLGGGQPILLNDDVIVPSLTGVCQVSLKNARHYGDVGCQENITDPNMTGADTNGRTNTGWINLPKPVELAIWNGVNPINHEQIGPQTGDPRTFISMQEFENAVNLQVRYLVKMNAIANNVYDYVFSQNYPCVVHNLLHPGPRDSGVDINAGGCQYNWTGCLAVGLANAGDMLSAIDTLIYQTGQSSWDELQAALQANWQGYESLHKKCVRAPKYGCDNAYADNWTRKFFNMLADAYESQSTPRGGRFVVGLISMANYVPLGKWLGATPDGRYQGERLADSTSPSHLAPNFGPTATHRSNAHAIDSLRTPNGVTFNQRFNAATINSPRDLNKWADLVRSFMEDGGMEVQYTVVSAGELREAQKNPAENRDLIVRVGGYSAVFVELGKDIQESIIARAEQSF